MSSSGGNGNQPIVVFQGATNTSVTLAATASNFAPTSYTWSQVTDTLNAYATTGTATFSATVTTLPQVTVTLPAIGIYQFQVVASDGTNAVTEYTWVNVWDNNPALNPNGTVGANPGISPPTSVRVLSPDPGPYCHPRVLFSRTDWPTLSGKLASGNSSYSSEAASAVTTLQTSLNTYFDKTGTTMNTLATELAAYGQGGYASSYYTNTLAPAYAASGAPTGELLLGVHPNSSLYDALTSACYLAWIGTDPTLDHASVPTAQQNRFTCLATVVAAAAQYEYTANSATVPNPNPQFDLAVCYDLLYDWMTPQQQITTRNYLYSIGNGVYNTAGGGTGSSLTTVPPGNQQNGQDFPNLADGIILADLAIEGEQSSVPASVQQAYYPFAAYATGPSAWPYADPASVSNLHRQIRANTEWNVTPWGFLMNMVDYFQLGQNTSMPGSLALARRGENQFVTANFYQSCLATIYNLSNREDGAGMDLIDHHDGNQMGDGPGGNGAVYIVKYMYPDDPMVDYFYRVYKREGLSNTLCQAMFGVTTMTNNLASVASAKGLALTKFDPLRAVAISRNGWNDTDLSLIYENRWDIDGHMHAERNNFSLYALGRAWSCPPGYHVTINDAQSSVLIQNSSLSSDPATQGYIGEAPSSATETNSQTGNTSCAPGKILQLTEEPNKLWTLFAGDASAAYNYGYVPGSSTSIDTGTQNANYTYPGLVGPLLNDDMASYLTGDLQVNQTGFNPVQYAIRSILTVRGTNPYVLVMDDINKDGTAHNYRWDMNCAIGFGSSGGQFVDANNNSVYSSLAVDTAASTPTATQLTLYHSPVDNQVTPGQTGLPRLLVRDLTTQSTSGQPAMFIDDRPANDPNGALTYGYDNNQKTYPTIPSRRLMIERDNVISPQYKVLLYPYTTGSSTPLTSWNANNTVLTVDQRNGTVDSLTFDSTNADHRTRLVTFNRTTGTGAPTLTLPANISVAASGTNSSGVPIGVATFTLSATAANGSALTPVASLPSGSSFPVGVTNVVVSAIDSLGQESTGTFTVTVLPPPPQLSVTNISNLGTSNYGITLSWPYYSGVTGYNVKRGTVSGGPYTTISANQSASNTTFTDSGLSSTTYFYVVTALLNGSESGPSNEIALTPATSPFTSTSLGLASGAGTYQTGGSYFLSSYGGNIGAYSETGAILLAPWTGDGIFTAHLASVSNQSVFCDLGVTFRASSTVANAAMSFVGFQPWTNTNYANFINRATTGALATTTQLTGVSAPSWYRLVRSGNTYAGYYSTDGANWTAVGSTVGLTLPTSGFAGLAVGSGNSVQTNGTFDNVVFLCTPALTPANGSVTLNWSESIGAASYSVKRATSAAGPFQTLSSGLSGTSYTDSTTTNLITYYYTVSATSASGSVTVSPVVSTTPSVIPPPSTYILPGNGQTYLSWSSVTGASTYSVLRSTVSGGPYQTIKSGLTTGSYNDTGLANGTAYYYEIVAATSGGGQSTPSTEVSGVPVLWSDQDIGTTSPAGSFSIVNTTINGTSQSTDQVAGSGAYIYNTSDNFNYLSRSWTGDGVFIAHVYSLTNPSSAAKAGVMFRASTGATAQNEAALDTYSAGVNFQSRTSTGGSTSNSGASGSAPVWVKLDRIGSTFTAFQSSDGVTWSNLGSAVTNAMASAGYAGLAVGSNKTGSLCTAIFDKTAFLVSPTSLASSSVSNYSLTLGWLTNANNNPVDATATQVEYSRTGTNSWTVFTSSLPATATSATVTGLAFGTTYDFRVKTILGSLSSDYATLTGVATSSVLPPAAPTGVAAVGGNAQVSLGWSASANASSYTVNRATVSGGPYTAVASGVTTTSYVDSTVTNGTTYYYVVAAVDTGGASPNSTEVSAMPLPPIPAAPSGLTAGASGAAIALAWTGPTYASGYNIKRSTVSGGPFTTIGTSTTTNYTDSNLVGGTPYYYVVSATNLAGEGMNSNQASATALSAFQQWLAANNLPTTTSPSSTPDKDGITLLMKFATALTPGTPSAAGPALISSSGDHLVLQFNRLNPAPVNYLVETSSDLVNWASLTTLASSGGSWTGSASVSETGSGPILVTVTDTASLSGGMAPRYLRLRVTTATDTTEPGTIPQGDVPVTVNPSSTSAISLTLDNTPVSRNGVQALTSSSITVMNAGTWNAAAAPYALRLLSGKGAGETFVIATQSGNTLTLTTQGVDLTQLAAVGDLYEILPLDTLSLAYGTANSLLQSGSSAASADNVLIWNGSTWLTYFNNGSGWKQSGSLLSQNNVLIPPGGGYLVTHRPSASLKYQVIGRVPEVALSQFTTPGGSTFLGAAYPLPYTLGTTGFAASTGWQSGASASSSDNVLVWNGSTWLTFYYNGTNWRQSGSLLNQNSYALPVGTPLFIQRHSAPAPINSFISQPLLYLP